MPTVQFVKFPNDHTCGTDLACPSPQAMVADSDWAFGMLNSFTNEPDFTPYNSVKPKQSLNEPTLRMPRWPNSRPRWTSAWRTQAPWQALNRAIWTSVRGRGSRMPTPKHNLPIEEEEE